MQLRSKKQLYKKKNIVGVLRINLLSLYMYILYLYTFILGVGIDNFF